MANKRNTVGETTLKDAQNNFVDIQLHNMFENRRGTQIKPAVTQMLQKEKSSLIAKSLNNELRKLFI